MTVSHPSSHLHGPSPSSSTHPPLLTVIVAGKAETVAARNVIETVVQLCSKKRPYVAYFGTAGKDRESRYISLALPYEEMGCQVTKVDLWNEEETMDKSEVREVVSEIVHRADIILLSGGSKSAAMIKWREYGIDEILIDAAYRTKPPIFVGGSAGALCLAHTGLQLVSWNLVPHYDTLLTHPKVTPPPVIFELYPRIPCFGLDEKCAWLIHGNETLALSQDGSSSCYHVYRQGGRIESFKLPLDEMIPLTSFGIAIGPTS